MFNTTASGKNCVLNGIFRIGDHRNITFSLENEDIFLVCKTFWKEEALFAPFSKNRTNYTEAFTVSNSNQFLEKVQHKWLNIEVSKIKNNFNPEVLGLLRLPLHQFFIAYRDASLTSRLNDGQFPVISTNKWVPVFSSACSEQIGEIECLLAMGTEKQILNFENSRTNNRTENIESNNLQREYIPTKKKSLENELFLPLNSKSTKTSELLDILHKSLTSTTSNTSHAQPVIQLAESNSFRIVLEIKSARNLQLNQSMKLKKKHTRFASTKCSKNINDQTGDEPSTYVTFQAKEGDGHMVKSHEGMVYSTAVIENNSNPVWNKMFCVSGTVNYLFNKNERFIIKIWKRAGKSNAHGKNLPCPLEDTIIGFASIGLWDLMENVPIINGWFDILDFSGHNNGQIHVVVKPFDDIKKLKELMRNNQVENLLHTFETSLDINNMSLCRAIKRKFTELEEISERLRVRLLDVTGSADVCKVAREISDEQIEEFEHDLNTSVCEDENESYSDHTNSINASPCSSHTH